MTNPSRPKRKRAKRQKRSDHDPIIGEYDIYLNAQGELDVYLCQYPTRNKHKSTPLTEQNNAKPTALRIKPRSGLVEVDVPIDTGFSYESLKGVRWGEAVQRNNLEQPIGAQGLPGGFGVGSVSESGRRTGAEAETRRRAARAHQDDDDDLEVPLTQEEVQAEFQRAVADGRAFSNITYGGKMAPRTDASPIYMIGAFRGREVHLTPLQGIVQLTPQFHHVDALADHDQQLSVMGRTRAETGPGTTSNDIPQAPPKEKEAKAVQMSNKPVIDGEEVDMAKTVNMLKAFQEEGWVTYPYEDENSATAWTAYERFFLSEAQKAKAGGLHSMMGNGEYLDRLSGAQTSHQRSGAQVKRDVDGERSE